MTTTKIAGYNYDALTNTLTLTASLEPITCCMFYQDTAKFQKVVDSCTVLQDSCNPHNQQNTWGRPELHSCAYKVASDFEGILAFHAGSALCTRYF